LTEEGTIRYGTARLPDGQANSISSYNLYKGGRYIMKRMLMAIMAVAVAVTFSAPAFADGEGDKKKKKDEKEKKAIEMIYGDEHGKKEEAKSKPKEEKK
jgi:hypothetical protein